MYGRILLDCDWSIDRKCKSLIGWNQTQHNYFGIIKNVLIYQCAQKARDSLIYILTNQRIEANSFFYSLILRNIKL